MTYNIFNEAHLPLKLALLNTCINLSKKNRFNKKEAINSVKKINEVLATFKEQITYENSVILPLIFDYEPSVWNRYASQHDDQLEQLSKLENALQTFYSASDEVEQFVAITWLDDLFNSFLMNNYHHMDDEEETLSRILQQYYTDDFLLQLGRNRSAVSARPKAGETRIFQPATAA